MKRPEKVRGTWRGFLIESKDYMGYGKQISKLKFWLCYPRVLFRFYWQQRADHLTIKYIFTSKKENK